MTASPALRFGTLTATVAIAFTCVACAPDGADHEALPSIQRSGRDGDEHEFGRTRVKAEDILETQADLPVAAETELLTFGVIGDFGTGTQSQLDIADRMCRYRTNHAYELVLTTGDNIYPSGEPHYFKPRFKRPYRCLRSDGVRFRATLGNHDIVTANGRYQLEDPAFGMPKRNYVFRRSGVRFVMANSNDLNLDWMRDAIKPQEGDLYTIVAMHHPVYSPGSHGSTPGFRPALPRMFERHGVDLVLTGHDHLYSTTKRLDGIRYVVTGGGGAPTYPCSDRWFVANCTERHHFLFVTVTAEEMEVRAIPAAGRAIHRFRIPHRG